MSIDKKEREDIRQEAFEEAAELVRKRAHRRAFDIPLLEKEILDLGGPKPDPRSRKIKVQLKEWTYTFDRDREHPVQRFRTGLGSGEVDRAWRWATVRTMDADLLLHTLEQERRLLGTERRLKRIKPGLPAVSQRDAARLEHLNLFLGGGEE